MSRRRPWISRADMPRAYIRDHLVVEPRQAPAVLLDKLWIESTLPIPGNRQLHPAIVGEHPLTTMAVAVVAAELLVFVVEMLIQLGIEDAFRQCLLQILDQIAALKCLKRVRSAQ